MAEKPCIVVHHGGEWERNPLITYIGGIVTIFGKLPEDIDPPYIRNLITSLGHKNVVKLHYLDCTKTINDGMRFLGRDDHYDPLLSLLIEFGEVHIYCEHDFVDARNCADVQGSSDGSVLDAIDLNSNMSFVELLTGNLGDDIDYDEEGSDNDDEEVVDARLKIKDDRDKQQKYEEELDGLERLGEWSKDSLVDASDYENSDEFDSPSDTSDEEDIGYLVCPKIFVPKKPKESVSTTPQDTSFFVGQLFDNAINFRKAIVDYSVDSGIDVKYVKNHRDKVGVKCKGEGCPWRIWASLAGKKKTFEVKTYIGVHKCGRGEVVKVMKALWIAKHYQKQFKINPYLKLQEIMDLVWSDKGIRISIFMAGKVRKHAQELVVGEYKEQYGLLHRYAAEILKSNPNNTAKFCLESNVFKRMYICFEALKLGFLEGCRPFISTDGCFLKGPYGGHLLVAVGRDGNNQMFPIAWACVEVESTESWCWFLELLASDLGTIDGRGYTIMSDQQKGLLSAMSIILPQCEHRCCARHIYMNFRDKVGGGQEYRKHFWIIARSSTVNDFHQNIANFRVVNDAATTNLLTRNYKRWCRAFYTPMSKCDNIDNNMAEVFNAYILNCRHKPIISMLEDIREKLMERMHKKRDFIGNQDIFLCPRIKGKLEKNKIDARGWCSNWDGDFCYGVRDGISMVKYVVDLRNRTCSCNLWQLNGIPCNHAVAAIWKNKEHPEHYVSEWYWKQGYMKAYQHSMMPLNGPREWPESPFHAVIAPSLEKVQACRPKKKRRLQAGESIAGKKSKANILMSCRRCGGVDHNVRRCPRSPPPVSATKAPKKQKRKKQSTAPTTSGLKPPANINKRGKVKEPATLPMHARGFGVYTYPDGYQRAGSMQNCNVSDDSRFAEYGDNRMGNSKE